MTSLPRPNPAIYPRMYTPHGRKLHRAAYRAYTREWQPLCNRVPWWHLRAVQGQPSNPLAMLIPYVPQLAERLPLCKKCQERAGRFA